MNTEEYGRRIQGAQAQMHAHGLDYLVVGPSADLRYLIGANHWPSPRLALLVVSQSGPAQMVLPAFEAPSLPPAPEGVQVVTWGESDNPSRLVANLIASGVGAQPGGARLTIGVSDRVWSVFLLQLQAELPRAAFTRGSLVLTALRQIKSEEEAGLLRQSGALADEVFSEIITRPFEGRTEREVGQELQRMLEARGLEVGHLPIVGSGPNGASPHHHSGSRVIERGDLVVLDFGGTLEGYFSDMTRTVFVGGAPPDDSEEVRVYRLVQQVQEAAVQAAKPGMSAESLDAYARGMFRDAGYGDYFIHRLGHGIGLDGHEPPYIVAGNATKLQPGMAFSVEPGLYLPGRFGVRIEDIVVLHETGAERLNNSTRDIVVVK